MAVIGLGMMMLVSALNPYQAAPFGGHHYLQWLAGMTILLGVSALVRGERGHLALLSAMVTVAAGAFLLLTLFIGVLSVVGLKLFMSE